ncbi:MAG: dicarboxylate/amino acid:cation symporter [Desulfobacteraceae bacterium]|nr:dicarboxylate/amino acid:cation symporter [Desulfobacteraceae bacterium]
MSFTVKILLYMIIGLLVGVLINTYAAESNFIQYYLVGGFFHIIGSMFLQALKMLVVPLVFCSLIGGIVGMNDMKMLGRTSGKAFALFLFTTIIAISFGLFFAISLGIGKGFNLANANMTSHYTTGKAPAFVDVIIGFMPSNIPGALANANMLQIIMACIFIGLAIMKSGKSGKKVAASIESFNEVMMALVHIIMSLAPYGVFCLMAKTFAEQGIGMVVPIISYFLTVAAALTLHFVGTFSGLFLVARLNPLTFIRKMRSTIMFAFSTSSSNATIPVSIETAETRLGVHNSIASFVIPLGATINMNGTAIMQGVATVFIANAYGITLSGLDYVTVIGMSVLASVGTAGVPGVGIVTLAMVFTQVGLPVEGIALILGVDRLIDMMRTVVNVTGDVATTCVVAKTEGKMDMAVYKDPSAGIAI